MMQEKIQSSLHSDSSTWENARDLQDPVGITLNPEYLAETSTKLKSLRAQVHNTRCYPAVTRSQQNSSAIRNQLVTWYSDHTLEISLVLPNIRVWLPKSAVKVPYRYS